MKTITIPMYVFLSKYSYQKKGLTFICQKDFEVEIPENYDPTAQKIAALEAQKEKARSGFAKLSFEINERINKLQALEFTK